MKKINILTLLLIALLGFLPLNGQNIFLVSSAQQGASYLTVAENDQIQNFTSEQSSKTITVETNLIIGAKSSENWCTPEVITTGNTKLLKISVSEYTGSANRSAEITLRGKDNKSAVIAVNQIGITPSIIVKQESIEVVDNNLSFEIEITSNIAFTFSQSSWIQGPNPQPGIGNYVYTFTADKYEVERSSREGFVKINSSDPAVEDINIPITQTFNGYPRFAVISDIHFGNSQGEGPMVKVPKALKNIFAQTPMVDALFVVGDLTDWGRSAQYDQLLTVFNDKTIVPEGVAVYFMMGNHDNYDENAVANYNKLGQPLHQYVEIKNYPFITTSMNGGSTNSYGQDAVDFLRNSLEDAAQKYPGKPIFVFTHVPPKGTVYGSNASEGGWGTDKFNALYEQYPQVIVFSGHSHFPLGDPRSIHQDKFTSVNDGSTTYSEVEPNIVNAGIHPEKYAYVTEGVIVNVDENMNVEMERWDTYRNEEILPRWNINAPHNGTNFAYKGRTGGTAPVFNASAGVTVSDITTQSCKVTFPQATDDEVVHRYKIEIVQENTVIATFSKFSEYYLNSQMPESFTITFNGIPSGTTLKARVKAIDSYNNESAAIESVKFTTGGSALGYNLPTTFPQEKLVGHWVFNSSGISEVKANSGITLTATSGSTNGVTYVTVDGIDAALVANSTVGGPTPNYLTLTHNLPATSDTQVKDYCIVMDIKATLSTSYLPLLWSHSYSGDADIFVKQAGSMGLSGGGLNYTDDGFVQIGWNRIVINANLSNMQLDFYCMYPDGTKKTFKKTVTSTERFSLRTNSPSDTFRDDGNEDGDAHIGQYVLFNAPLSDAEITGILTAWPTK